MGHTLLCVLPLPFLSLLLCCGDIQAWLPLLTVSPSWLSPGASVNLSCRVKAPSPGWVFYWYEAVPDLLSKNYKYKLLPDSINGTVEDFYIIYGQRHTAGYACRAQRGNPEYLTDYSEPKFVWSADSHPEAALTVSPDREKLFTLYFVQMNCQGNHAGWRVRKFEITGYSTYLTDCSSWGTMTGSSCTVNRSWSSNAVYWCESGSGDFSNAVNVTLHKPESVLTVSPSWLSPGASVTLSCKVGPPSAEWRFYWFKAVPDPSHRKYKYEVLPDSISGTVQDSYIIHGQTHTAGYTCRATRRNPEYSTDYSEPKFAWSRDSHPAASLIISPHKEKHFNIDNVNLNCQGNSAKWRVRFELPGNKTDLSYCSNWGTMTGSSCTIKSHRSHRAVYWCESETGQFSNAVNITIQTPQSVLTVSPSWLSPGASVTLSCEVKHPSAGWRFYWYKTVPDPSNSFYRYDLLPDSINETVEDSYIIQGQRHTAAYSCRAGRGNPEYLTDYSEPKFVWSADFHPASSLTVSPDREQHFTSESVTLNCGGNSAEWRVRRFTDVWSDLSYCSDWGKMTASSCTINSDWYRKAVYWCESGSGEFSNAVNITVHNGDLVLVSPINPVTESASVSLSCRLRGQNTVSNVIFHHNDKMVQNDSREELNISTVSQSDEGFYKCEHSGRVSPQSWMAVQVIGVVLVILLLLLCRYRQSRDSASLRPSEDPGNGLHECQHVTYALVDFKHFENKRRQDGPETVTIYSHVKTEAAGTVSSNTQCLP
ncbi:hypothetical protein ILYODFUR_022766 [Ilyodon furcidens]|uniref:Ig-like domain-containing protein n=1 Tax=Ilyodon furcidens TaxID=33524 RepID=A0ABV0SZ94_9TELE